jgi:hypothetical protein
MLILEENDLEDFVKEEFPEPNEDEAKEKYKKNLVKAKRIIVDSIKDQLIPHVSSLITPKQMFDALSRLYEGKNIKRKMTLRTQLKNVEMQSSETIQSYITRVSQIKEPLEAIRDTIEEAKLVMTTFGLPGSWESFIQAICSRRRLTSFSRLWEDCSQEEARFVAREEKLGEEKNQALAAHIRKGKRKKEIHSHKKPHGLQKTHKFKKDFSSYRCFIC